MPQFQRMGQGVQTAPGKSQVAIGFLRNIGTPLTPPPPHPSSLEKQLGPWVQLLLDDLGPIATNDPL